MKDYGKTFVNALGLQIDPNAGTGRVLQSDASGRGTWGTSGVTGYASTAGTAEFATSAGNAGTSYRAASAGHSGTAGALVGVITNANQPSFLAFLSATVTDITGDNIDYLIIFNSEVFDQNGDYNTATGIFTAPVTGRYRFSAQATLLGLAAAHNIHSLLFYSSNRNGAFQEDAFVAASNPFVTERTLLGSILLDMDVSDTIYIAVNIRGGTRVVDVYGNATNLYTYFCGELIC